MMRTCLIGAWLALAPSIMQAQPLPDSLSLEQFLAAAWPAAHRLEAGRARAEAGDKARRAGRAQRGPVLALDLSAARISRHQELDMPGQTVEFGDGNSADATLLGTWTLYAGGAPAEAERAAGGEARARRHDLAADSLLLADELRGAFYGALAAEAALAAAWISQDRLERHLRELELRKESGLADEAGLLLGRSRLAQARQEHERRLGERNVAELELGALCGIHGSRLRPHGDLESPLTGIGESVDSLPSLQALEARLEAAAALARQRAGLRRPRVDAGVGWHYARPGVDPVANEWMGYVTASLRLRWTLADNGLARLRQAEATLEARSLDRRLADATQHSAAGLARQRELVRAARAAWEIAVERTGIEARRLELAESRWRQGLATERDWLDSQDDARLAVQERALAAARLRQAESRLMLAQGR